MGDLATVISFSTSGFPPLAVGFMGLGTGYLIYGLEEAFGFPPRDRGVDGALGIWGLFLPGFMQLFAGAYLFAGLLLFESLKTPPFYMAALAFTAYGVHWFAIGWTRMRGSDVRVNLGMAVGYLIISALGVTVFFAAGDNPVGGLFIGLVLVYLCEIVTALEPIRPALGRAGIKALGFVHLGTGLWLLYLMWAATTTFALHWTLPL